MVTESLNDIQRQAAEQTKGPILIVAGAGSGKTRTLTYRIAHLLEIGVSPYSIMALTFTNKAAKEMQDRVIGLVGIKSKAILMGTFHSIFSRILRIDGYRIGYNSNYTIYDDEDSKRLLGTIIKEMNLDDKVYKKKKILSRISRAKCALFSPADYEKNIEARNEDELARIPLTFRIYAIYQNRLRQAMAMDFDDILFNINVLFRDCKDVLEKYQHRFQYILVDEYQDTNFAQYLIVKKLAEYYRNICVVGDDAQSIYSFRGATIENILNFRSNYPDATIYKLEENYRSTKNIINAANSVIEKNEHQIPKHLFTNNQSGDKLIYAALPSDREEAEYISQRIKYFVSKDEDYRDIAILYRTNSQSRSLEDCLRLKNIPYIIYGGTSFYARKEIKDCIAYMRLVVNNDDNEAFERIINYPSRGIGKVTMDRLKLAAQTNRCSLFAMVERLEINNPFKLSLKSISELQNFCTMIKIFSLRVKEENAYDLGNDIIKRSGIEEDLRLLRDEADKDKEKNIKEFRSSLKSFVEDEQENIIDALTGEQISIKNKTLDVFLQQVSLMTTTDEAEGLGEDDNKVKLMTVHASKGLEFDTVFVSGMEENLFPSLVDTNITNNEEEERRLFYVALTRAKKHLILTSAKVRYRNGETIICETSHFVKQIDKRYISYDKAVEENTISNIFDERVNEKIVLKKKQPLSSLRYNTITKPSNNIIRLNKKIKDDQDWFSPKIDEIQEGMIVMHIKFGIGKVLEIYKQSGDKRAVVKFDDYEDEKTLVLKFAKLAIKKNKE
jgi:DNA helicase II / ATP-dependent DNA helicase PcrA